MRLQAGTLTTRAGIRSYSVCPAKCFLVPHSFLRNGLLSAADLRSQPNAKLCNSRCSNNSRSSKLCVSFRAEAAQEDQRLRPDSVSVVLLAGGSGKRMGASIPKQYLDLVGQPIAMYSLQAFARMPEVFEIVVVCNPEYRSLFQKFYDILERKPALVFAEPGVERQDSVSNGFQAIDRSRADLVAIHDSARPLVTEEDTRSCFLDALQIGAAVLGVPVKPTIKDVDDKGLVVKTLLRAHLWEVQTPQVIRPDLLQAGFELVNREKLEVTDDVSIIEALGKPVKLTRGSYTNIKVTTPDDMLVAVGFLADLANKAKDAAEKQFLLSG